MIKYFIIKILLFGVLLITISSCCSSNNQKSEIVFDSSEEIEVNWETKGYFKDSENVFLECENEEDLEKYANDFSFFEAPKEMFISLLNSNTDVSVGFAFPGNFNSIEKLTLSGINSFDCLEIFRDTPLTELHINNYCSVEFIETGIKKVYISQSTNINWESLKNVSNLEYLYISNLDSFPNFEALSNLDDLTKVWLEYNIEEWENFGVDSKKLLLETSKNGGIFVLSDRTIPEWLSIENDNIQLFLKNGKRQIIIRVSPH